MPYSTNVIRLLEKVEPTTREALIAVLEEIEKQREVTVTKAEFNELKSIVRELTEAHLKSEKRLTRLEERVSELVEAQNRTEARLNALADRVNELAQAQKKTEQRVNELAQAQKKTEQRVNELAEAQKQTEARLNSLADRVNELAEAQKKTEDQLRKLIGEHRKTREQVGGLAHAIGYLLEDRAYVGLPPLIEKELGLKVITPLKRDFLEVGHGQYLEVNILGRAAQNGREIWIIGECKTQLKKRDVDRFLKTISKAREILGEDILPVMVAYHASPQLQRYVKEKNIHLYFSYQFPLVS